MAQPCITTLFRKRKRVDDGKTKSKVFVQESPVTDLDEKVSNSPLENECNEGIRNVLCGTPAFKKETTEEGTEKRICDAKIISNDKPTHSKAPAKKVSSKATKIKFVKGNNADIRSAFKWKDLNDSSKFTTQGVPLKSIETASSEKKLQEDGEKISESENRVMFELLGKLSPLKKKNDQQKTMGNESPTGHTTALEITNARKELGLMTPKKIIQQRQKDITMNEIKEKLSRSSRLAELKESIKKFNKKGEQLKELETERKKIDAQSPQLQKFKSIDVVVDISPKKSTISSPIKGSPMKTPLSSPLKSPLASPLKPPAHERFAHLAKPGVPGLTLPYSYRCLGEMFRSTDTVASIFYNRREVVTFQKLKSAVQEMIRRNFIERHLGQIKRVNPKAYSFSQEKRCIFGSKAKYELVVTPIIEKQIGEVLKTSNGCTYILMTPSILVDRREEFHNHLMEIVKDHHEMFLKSLSPPISIPSRSDLTRWHPDFDLERVPSVAPDELPQPPNEEKYSTAQDVLSRAKDLFSCNQRMEKALQKVSEQRRNTPETVTNDSEGGNEAATSSLLKGVPKALLEKIRAKQAAKALLAMTRTPAENCEALRLIRLPEITRVLWNIFVAEKKNVLLFETALTKLGISYRESLSSVELERHIRLLIKVVPGWLEIHHVRQSDYLKLSRNCDISSVIKKLEVLSAERNQDL